MAVPLDDVTRAAVAATALELRERAGRLPVSWVAPENFHVTLKFLGGIDEARLPFIVTALQASSAWHAPFPVDIRGLGAFPSATRARVLWAGVGDGGEALGALAGSVDEGLAKIGFPAEDRPFSAHVTIGRVRMPGRAPELTAALMGAAARPFGRVDVHAILLMRSDLSSRGARYTVLARVPLTGQP